MEDIGKIVVGFSALFFGVYILSIVAKELSVTVPGLQLGPLIVGAFVIYVLSWILKEVFGR